MSTTTRIGNYTIIRQLGAGGMAQIFEARDSQNGMLVALKMQADATISVEDLRRFRREADVLRSLSHPNIITVYDVGTEGGRPYIAVELIKGGSVEQALQQRGAFPPKEAMRLMIAILDGLAHAHARDLIHRDIKPANVLLRADGTPVLADFDLARPPHPSPHARITAEGERLGTPAYMAPEQIRGDTLESRTDLYACGVMLYEMLTGRLPFEGDLTQIIVSHLQKQPPALRARLPQASPYLELLLNQLLAKKAQDRPESADIVRTALLDIQMGRPTNILQSQPAAPAVAATPGVPAANPGATPGIQAAPWVGQALRILGSFYVILLIMLVIAALITQQPTIDQEVIRNAIPPVASTAVEVAISTPAPRTTEVDPTSLPAPTATSESLQRATEVPTDDFVINLTSTTDTATPSTLHDLEAAPMVLLRNIENTDGGSFTMGSLTITPPDSGHVATVYGELRNDDDLPREVTQLSAQLANEQSTPLNTLVIGQQILAPGEATAFSIKVSLPDADTAQTIDNLEFSIRSKPAENPPAPAFSIKNLFILQRTEDGTQNYSVIGTMNKKGAGNLARLQMLLIFYDNDDNVRGFNLIRLDSVSALVASDEQINFIAKIEPTIDGVVKYRAVVQ